MRSLILLTALAVAPAAHATEIGSSRPFGLGIQLGDPSGLSGKYYLGGRRNAISFAVGTYYGDRFGDSFWAGATYDFHMTELTSGGGVTIPWRVGIGGFLGSGRYKYWDRYYGDLFLGARVPIGLDFDLEQAPVQFYIEAALDLLVVPGITAGLDAGIGARYYF